MNAAGQLVASARAGVRRRLVCYFALACGLSWLWLVPLMVSGAVVHPGDGRPSHFPALIGPAVAAVVTAAVFDGRAGVGELLRRVIRLRVPLRWWAVALSPVAILAAVLLTGVAMGGSMPATADLAVMSGLPAGWGVLGVVSMVLVVNGFGEETGWRGFALPVAQGRFGPLSSTMIVAGGWAVWHLPLFAVVESFRDFGNATLVGWLLGLFCGAVFSTWLFNRSGGSVAIVPVWHGAYNVASATRAAEGLVAAMVTTVVIVAALALVGAEIRAITRHTVSVLA
ncbi:CPBP family intramembrane glutamic endopeptidase [Nocardia wallacei]|uniref:CAAX amino protease n=1 Tax=Nocardia wallacei TaxID=480035 RepID=A0A7G1KN48_9NOCA|nr:CPBP family intramembrane glutamic endopeptidase [Nocardia wallacei]BCK56046.1 CAAX amino protease [Nocardia wallacei]